MAIQDGRKISAALDELAGEPLSQTEVQRPIVCIDRDYKAIGGYSSLADVVRVHPDDWPGYADAAFMRVEHVTAENTIRTSSSCQRTDTSSRQVRMSRSRQQPPTPKPNRGILFQFADIEREIKNFDHISRPFLDEHPNMCSVDGSAV